MRRSIYTKLVVSFIVVFVISNIISSLMSYYGTEMNSVENLENQLVETLEVIDKGNIEVDEAEELLSNNYIIVSSTYSIDDFKLTNEQIDSIHKGSIIHVRAKEHQHETLTGPVALLMVDDDFVIATANFDNLGFSTRQLVMEINVRSLIIGSLLFIVVARLMVKPIKQLIDAVNKVSKKEFDVHLDTQRKDEMGVLMNNFNVMTQELSETEMLRDNFISDVSHEFKTPLTSIKGYTKLLEDATDEERLKYINVISDEVDHLSLLSTNILLLNRLDHKQKENYKTTFSLDEQLRKSIVLLQHEYEKKNIDIIVDLDEVSLEGNEVLFFQVWSNLLSNAIKFSKNNSQIEVSLKKTNNIEVIIKDNGIGMSEQEKFRMFDKFYKSDISRSDVGNGLGLSIVKRVIDIHNGAIEVDSKINEGTTIKIKL